MIQTKLLDEAASVTVLLAMVTAVEETWPPGKTWSLLLLAQSKYRDAGVMVCEPTQGLFFLGREEEVYNVPQNVYSKLTMWEKLVGEAEAGRHSTILMLLPFRHSPPVAL